MKFRTFPTELHHKAQCVYVRNRFVCSDVFFTFWKIVWEFAWLIRLQDLAIVLNRQIQPSTRTPNRSVAVKSFQFLNLPEKSHLKPVCKRWKFLLQASEARRTSTVMGPNRQSVWNAFDIVRFRSTAAKSTFRYDVERVLDLFRFEC